MSHAMASSRPGLVVLRLHDTWCHCIGISAELVDKQGSCADTVMQHDDSRCAAQGIAVSSVL